MTARLAPSVISADQARFGEQLAAVEPFAERWHVDVMDGHYVPNLTIGPSTVRTIARVSGLPQDVHLMVTNPDETWQWYAEAGAARLAFHPATSPDPAALLERFRAAGAGGGVAVNPDEGTDLVRPLLGLCDHVIVMSVQPGFSGQRFIPSVLAKVEQLRAWVDADGLGVDLVVDGGVSLDTAGACLEAGADVLVSASAIFGAPDPAAVASELAGLVAGRTS